VFVGHFALALAARPHARTVSLGWLMAASYGLDLLWPLLLLAGLERVAIEPGNTAFMALRFDAYPWSHSLAMSLLWGGAVAAFAAWRGVGRGGALLLGGLVASHWVLDLVMHRPDLPLLPWTSPLLGLGVWNSIPATLALEGSLYLAGIALYLRGTRPKRPGPSPGLVALLVAPGLMWSTSPLAPLPTGTTMVAALALAVGLLFVAAHVVDRSRTVVSA